MIGERLAHEMERKGGSLYTLSELTELSVSSISGIFKGTREPDLEELFRVCDALNVNPYQIMSRDYVPCRLHFRNVNEEAQAIASEVENAFLLMREFLPEPEPFSLPQPGNGYRDYQFVISAVIDAVKTFQSRFGNDLFDAIDGLNLPVVPIRVGEGCFDGFLMNADRDAAICVNEDSPPSRIRFTLLHELAHYLFHRDEELPVELWRFNFYDDILDRSALPEYVATKFAQYFLIPFEEAEMIWQKSDFPDYVAVDPTQEILDRRKASIDVLANALYDIARIQGRELRFTIIRDSLNREIKYPNDCDIWGFLGDKKRTVEDILENHKDDFSDEVLADIKDILQIQDSPGVMFA